MADQRPHLKIDHWLEKLDLLIYRSIFKDYQGVEEILWITERDLKNLGIKSGSHRARIGTSLAILKDKYEKNSREGKNYLSPHRNSPTSEKARSNTSISPVIQRHFEEPQSGVRSWPSTSHNTKHSSPGSSTENFVGTEATAEELKRALEKELSLDSSDLRSYAWYHGTILRQRAEELVVQDGSFLVRDCISQPGDYVITCKWKSIPLHFIIRKVILQPDTVYERIQYCFEKESFDSIPDFVRYYVGSKCPLSVASGVIISHPVNRIMPLSYYASRYGIQCQIHYVAKALENIPLSPENPEIKEVVKHSHEFNGNCSPIKFLRPTEPRLSLEEKAEPDNIKISVTNSNNKRTLHHGSNLIRMGSDPTLSPNTERRTLERRPNSGLFNSETIETLSVKYEDKPPPKPSRVPSKKCVQRPVFIKRERKISEHEDIDVSMNSILIMHESIAHRNFSRQISETRFSFLDRPSVSSGNSTPDIESVSKCFTIPQMDKISMFEPQRLVTPLLTGENPPLQGDLLSEVRHLLLSSTTKMLAAHLTRMDLETAKHFEDVDLGLGVTSGLELLLLPQGEQMQKDLFERTESLKLFIAVLILTTPEEEERVKVLNKWIEIAIETKTVLGNLFGFTCIMLSLTLPEVLGLQTTWLALRHSYTENAFVFETKLRPTFKALHNASGLEAPNTCLPYVLSLILILQQYISVMNSIVNESMNFESVSDDIMKFNLPGTSSSGDFGLQLLANHLETGRNIMQQIPIFKKNGEMSLQNMKYNKLILDIFNTDFHLRVLWGYRGSVVCTEQRHQIFQKVIFSLYNKCISTSS